MAKKKHIAHLLLEYLRFCGIINAEEIEGVWEKQINEQWKIMLNPNDKEINKIPPYSWYVEYNGWPAGSLSILGDGVLCEGMGGNESNLRKAIYISMKN